MTWKRDAAAASAIEMKPNMHGIANDASTHIVMKINLQRALVNTVAHVMLE